MRASLGEIVRHAFSVLVACLVIACGSRDPDCGATTGLIVVGGRCVCPMGTRAPAGLKVIRSPA